MTRHERVVEELLAASEINETVRAIGFFPKDWRVSVQISDRKPGCAHRGPMRHSRKGGEQRLHHIRLTLPRNWIDSVHKNRLAVISEFFILTATPVMIPTGADGAWHVRAMKCWPCRTFDSAVVKYGGKVSLACSVKVAMNNLLELFEKDLGLDPMTTGDCN